jgi:hypothetical protein
MGNHFVTIFSARDPKLVIQEVGTTLEATFVGSVVGKLQILNATDMQIRVMYLSSLTNLVWRCS